jgi:hypothetical protein
MHAVQRSRVGVARVTANAGDAPQEKQQTTE